MYPRRYNLETKLEKAWPEYLTTGAVARHCGVSKVTVLRWIEKGELTAFRLPGGQNRVHRDDFYAFTTKHNIPIKKYTGNSKSTGRAIQAGD
jgi:excisionase family DNA binding protein